MRVERLLCAALSSAAVVVACTGTPGTMYYETSDRPGGSGGTTNADPGGAAGFAAAGREARGGASALQGGRAGADGVPLAGGPSSSSGADAGQTAGSSGALGAGGEASIPPAMICGRFLDPGGVVRRVAREYQRAVFNDCRVAGMITRLEETSDFANAVVRYSLWLWGCPGTMKDAEFGLVYQAPELSRADAALLIDHYLAVSTDLLELSGPERAAMRAELARGAAAALTNPSESTLTMSVCTSGGEGGQGGAGGELGAGSSGAPGNAGAGVGAEAGSGGIGDLGGVGGAGDLGGLGGTGMGGVGGNAGAP